MNFPGSSEPFTEFEEPTASAFSIGQTLYIARSATHRGVFRFGPTAPLFDTNTLVPGGNHGETFSDFQEAVDEHGIALIGQSAARAGVYALAGGGYMRIADTTMSIPAGTGVFTRFDSINFHGGNLGGGLPVVVFLGEGSGGQKGIFGAKIHGFGSNDLGNLISVGGTLDGKVVTDLAMTNQSLFAYDLYFRANFADGSSGIYRVQVPEPGGALTLALALSGTFLRRRSRTHSVK
jgi:hypothetical protein